MQLWKCRNKKFPLGEKVRWRASSTIQHWKRDKKKSAVTFKRNAEAKRSQRVRFSENNIVINAKFAKFVFEIKAMNKFLPSMIAQAQAELPFEAVCTFSFIVAIIFSIKVARYFVYALPKYDKINHINKCFLAKEPKLKNAAGEGSSCCVFMGKREKVMQSDSCTWIEKREFVSASRQWAETNWINWAACNSTMKPRGWRHVVELINPWTFAKLLSHVAGSPKITTNSFQWNNHLILFLLPLCL